MSEKKKAAAIQFIPGEAAPSVIAKGKGVIADKILEAQAHLQTVYSDTAVTGRQLRHQNQTFEVIINTREDRILEIEKDVQNPQRVLEEKLQIATVVSPVKGQPEVSVTSDRSEEYKRLKRPVPVLVWA